MTAATDEQPAGEQSGGAQAGGAVAAAVLDTRIDLPEFSYLRLRVAPDPVAGGQTITHTVQAHGPQRPSYMLFTHFRPEGVQPVEGLYSKFADDTPDSVHWAPGQILSVAQTFRLPPGRYEVLVGFIAHGTRERLTLPGYHRNILPVGSITIDAAPLALLQRSSGLIASPPERLLDDILALAPVAGDQSDHLTACFGQAAQFGHVLEFGVASGKSVNHLASLAPHRTIWGFDTFEGLPEEWVRSDAKTLAAGTFSQQGQLPPVKDNVVLVKGLIQGTLPVWLRENPGNVAFVHVDVDIYSAARFVLDALNERIVPGTVIVFDDMGIWNALRRGTDGGYAAWRDGEWKALIEWLDNSGRRIAVTSRGTSSVLGVRVLE